MSKIIQNSVYLSISATKRRKMCLLLPKMFPIFIKILIDKKLSKNTQDLSTVAQICPKQLKT